MRRRLLGACTAAALVLLCLPTLQTPVGAAGPAFVQVSDQRINSGSTLTATFGTPNAAGNLIVVYVIWNSLANVAVSDSAGNVYVSTGPPTRWKNNSASSQLFYAVNVAGRGNAVTATFTSNV